MLWRAVVNGRGAQCRDGSYCFLCLVVKGASSLLVDVTTHLVYPSSYKAHKLLEFRVLLHGKNRPCNNPIVRIYPSDRDNVCNTRSHRFTGASGLQVWL